MADGLDAVDLPTPAVLKPFELWTGKQLFSVLVRPNARTAIFVNLECAEKVHTKKGEPVMCPADGYVIFRNSELLCGRLGKTVLGGGNKGGLFATLNSGACCVCVVCVGGVAGQWWRWGFGAARSPHRARPSPAGAPSGPQPPHV